MGDLRLRTFRLRTATRDDVASEQALVLAPFPIRDDGILGGRSARLLDSRLDGICGRGGSCLRLAGLPGLPLRAHLPAAKPFLQRGHLRRVLSAQRFGLLVALVTRGLLKADAEVALGLAGVRDQSGARTLQERQLLHAGDPGRELLAPGRIVARLRGGRGGSRGCRPAAPGFGWATLRMAPLRRRSVRAAWRGCWEMPIPAVFQTAMLWACLLYTSPSPRDRTRYRMPSSA